MLVGEPPFKSLSGDPWDTFRQTLSGRFYVPPNISPTAADLIYKLLQVYSILEAFSSVNALLCASIMDFLFCCKYHGSLLCDHAGITRSALLLCLFWYLISKLLAQLLEVGSYGGLEFCTWTLLWASVNFTRKELCWIADQYPEMQVNPENRLGSGTSGCKEIMSHEWFSSINWSSIESRTQEAPMLPEPEFDTDKLIFTAFRAEQPKNPQTRKDIFGDEWEELWEWVGDRASTTH